VYKIYKMTQAIGIDLGQRIRASRLAKRPRRNYRERPRNRRPHRTSRLRKIMNVLSGTRRRTKQP